VRVILVIDRRHLFPGLSPQGFLPPEAVDLEAIAPHFFFAERSYMETCSHFKQIIPYLVLTRGQGPGRRVLVYQRRVAHSEERLKGLWSVGFGGHIEPLDRTDRTVAASGLLQASALRELSEETGIDPLLVRLDLLGYINSDSQDVSSVHFGVVYRVPLDSIPQSDEDLLARVSDQAEPYQARWLSGGMLTQLQESGRGPNGGSFEDWSRQVILGGRLQVD
jgi:predicted NUDIX family phosphoesterase